LGVSGQNMQFAVKAYYATGLLNKKLLKTKAVFYLVDSKLFLGYNT